MCSLCDVFGGISDMTNCVVCVRSMIVQSERPDDADTFDWHHPADCNTETAALFYLHSAFLNIYRRYNHTTVDVR